MVGLWGRSPADVTPPRSRHNLWLTVATVGAVLGASLAVWYYVSLPSTRLDASPLQPWFFTEGANASWDVRRRTAEGEWRNETATMAVVNVSEDYVLFRIRVDDSYLNHPVPMKELFDYYTTLGASMRVLETLGFEILEYQAELGVIVEAMGSVAVLHEIASSVDPFGNRATSEKFTELANVIAVRQETTIVFNSSGFVVEFYELRTLTEIDGVALTLIDRTVSASFDLTGEHVAFQMFNGDSMDGRTEAGNLVLDLESRSSSILASIEQRGLFASVAEASLDIRDLAWALYGRGDLVGIKLEAGRNRLTLGIAETPLATATSFVVATAGGARAFSRTRAVPCGPPSG